MIQGLCLVGPQIAQVWSRKLPHPPLLIVFCENVVIFQVFHYIFDYYVFQFFEQTGLGKLVCSYQMMMFYFTWRYGWYLQIFCDRTTVYWFLKHLSENRCYLICFFLRLWVTAHFEPWLIKFQMIPGQANISIVADLSRWSSSHGAPARIQALYIFVQVSGQYSLSRFMLYIFIIIYCFMTYWLS